MRGFLHPPRDHARAAMDNRMLAVQACQLNVFDAAMLVQLFRIDDRTVCIQRHGAAGITRAAARGIMTKSSSIKARTKGATSASVSGLTTTNGYSTRQSVASVTCVTRANPSNMMLCGLVILLKRSKI